MAVDELDALLAKMQAAVKTAVDCSSAAPRLAPPIELGKVPLKATGKKGLVHALMLGVELRYGIQPGEPVERKLNRIFEHMPESVLREWVEEMSGHPAEHPEWQSLVESLTIHETYFCREPDLMRMLMDDVYPWLIGQADHRRRLKVWSAASSTGEETYDLCFLALQALQRAGHAKLDAEGAYSPNTGWLLEVLGTDISNQAIRTARDGVYGNFGMGSFRTLPPEWRGLFEEVPAPPDAMTGVRFFSVRDWLRRWVRFERFNLCASHTPAHGMDLVVCRNVLIYFDDPVKKQVQAMLARAMVPGGALIMGAAAQMMVPELFEYRSGPGGPWYVRNEVPAT